jgi:hypothetical protein
MEKRGVHKLNDLIFLINKPLIGKKGLHYQKLLKDWAKIVGDEVARYAIPTKISTLRQKNKIDNVLYMATNNSAAATELVYLVGVVREQINFYFGYEYIQQIKLVQAAFKVKVSEELIVKKLSPEQSSQLDSLINQYNQEDEIKELLTNIGALVLQKSQLYCR